MPARLAGQDLHPQLPLLIWLDVSPLAAVWERFWLSFNSVHEETQVIEAVVVADVKHGC